MRISWRQIQEEMYCEAKRECQHSRAGVNQIPLSHLVGDLDGNIKD